MMKRIYSITKTCCSRVACMLLAGGLAMPLMAGTMPSSIQLAKEHGMHGEYLNKSRDMAKEHDRAMKQAQLETQMRNHLRAMDQVRDRLSQTNDQPTRAALMSQYRDQIRAGVQLMNEMQPTAAGAENNTQQLEQHQQLMGQMMQHIWHYQELQGE